MGGVEARLLDAPPLGWDALQRTDPNATPAHRPEVWRALGAVLSGVTVRFVAVEEGGELLGGSPILIARRAGFHWIHAMPFVLPGAPLAREGTTRAVDAAVGAAIADLQRNLGVLGGEWVLYRPCGPEVEPQALSPTAGETRILETSVIDLGGGIEALERSLDRDTRHDLRAARGRGLRFAEEPEALEEGYALHLGQGRRWRGHRPLPLELSRRLLEPGASSPPGRLFTLRDARGLLIASLFLDHSRETLAWWSGTRAGPRSRYAAPFFFWCAAEWASVGGRARLNLGGSRGLSGLLAFKRSLGARSYRYPVRWLDARHGPWIGRVLAGLQGRLHRGRFRGDVE